MNDYEQTIKELQDTLDAIKRERAEEAAAFAELKAAYKEAQQPAEPPKPADRHNPDWNDVDSWYQYASGYHARNNPFDGGGVGTQYIDNHPAIMYGGTHDNE